MNERAVNSYSWVDAKGALHFSIPKMLAALGVADTPENRAECTLIAQDHLRRELPRATLITTEAAR